MSDTLKKTLNGTAVLHAVGFILLELYLLLASLTASTAHYIGDCRIRKTFFVYCPGCGATRSLTAFLSGHPLRSLLYYPTFFLAALLILWADFWICFGCITRDETKLKHIHPKIFWLLPVVAVLYAILRTVLAYTVGFDPLGDLTTPH